MVFKMNRLTQHFFKADKPVFTQADVATSIPGTDFSRHALIKRAIAKDEILNIRRGLYCLAPPYQKRPLNVYSIAQRVYGPSYVSLESALSYHGWIPEAVYACTCASYPESRQFDTPLGIFSYKRVPQRVFFAGVERLVDASANVFFMASPAKALADYIYLHRPKWSTIGAAIESLRLDPGEVANASALELRELANNYRSRRARQFLSDWLKALAEGVV